MNQLTDYIRVYENQVDDDLCKTIIDKFNSSEKMYVDREGRPTFYDLNLSKSPAWTEIKKQLEEAFDIAVDQYIEDIDCRHDFPQRWMFEHVRMKMYEPNGRDQFKTHVDVGDHSSAVRFLVGFLYLNDVEEGGETSFPKLNYAVKPKCGRIVLFPPTWQYRHAGLPPVSSKKYIVGTYLHYTMQGMTQTIIP